jgi:uncharacterized circularly permuted ATP-grasp superfamily protein
MVDEDGRVRRLAEPLVDRIAGRMPRDGARPRTPAPSYLSDAGVFYRAYGNGADDRARLAAFDICPLLIDEAEWSKPDREGMSSAPNCWRCSPPTSTARIGWSGRSAAAGSLIASNPEFLRPMVGVRPADGHFLHFCAFETRPRAGRALVGAGGSYRRPLRRRLSRLENRVATTRAFSDVYAETHVHRLAGFFGAFRDALLAASITAQDPERVAVLTPGPGQRDLFRARLYRPLSRLHAARGRGPDRDRRPR